MKRTLSGPLKGILIALIGCSLLYLSYLVTVYFDTLDMQLQYGGALSAKPKKMEECNARAPFDKVSVSEFIDGTVPDFYTWRYADDGKDLGQQYLHSLCDISLQNGVKLTSQEATRIARMLFVIPEIEFNRGIANAWWLWIVSITCVITLFISSRQNRFDPEGDIDEIRRRDPILILKKSFDYRGRFDVVQWLIVILFWAGVNILLWFIPYAQSNLYAAILLLVFFASIISTCIASVRRLHDYRKSGSRIVKPKHWIYLAWIYLVFNVCLFLLFLISWGLLLLSLWSTPKYYDWFPFGYWDFGLVLFLIIFLATAIVALHIARPQTIRINKIILRTIAWLLTVVLGPVAVGMICNGLIILLEPGLIASSDRLLLPIFLYCLIGLALSQRAIRQSKHQAIEMDSDTGDIIDSSSQDKSDV